MKQWVILSGKGGTGKTTVTAALAHLAADTCHLVLADADVDAANLELVLAPTLETSHEFQSGELAVIDPALCVACGSCAEACRFEAIVPGEPAYRVDPLGCEGCAACTYRCPAGAIRMVPRDAGRWFISQTRFGPLYHAQLFAGGENSGKLVTLLKQTARLHALDDEADLLLVDGPPGIGCPAIATLSGADFALIVTEATAAGAHDVERILDTAAHFRVPSAVLLNKEDLNPAQAEAIAAHCADRGVPLLGHLPYDLTAIEAMSRAEPVTVTNGPLSTALRHAWEALKTYLYSD